MTSNSIPFDSSPTEALPDLDESNEEDEVRTSPQTAAQFFEEDYNLESLVENLDG